MAFVDSPNPLGTPGNESITRTINGKTLDADVTLVLNTDFDNQGTTTTVLHGNASGDLSWGQVSVNDVANDTFTYAKLQNVSATNKLLGRVSSGAGDIEELDFNDVTIGLNSVFNVEDYGATGDGSTDDTTAINAAITAAITAGGGTVFFPKPSSYYKVAQNSITISSTVGITLKGAGMFTTPIKTSAVATADIIEVTGDNVVIEDLQIDGNYTSGATSGTFGLITLTDASKVTIQRCNIINSQRNGVRLYGNTTDVWIRDNVLSNNYCGIYGYPDTGNDKTVQRINITGNQILDGWDVAASDQTGGIKLSAGSTTEVSAGHNISNNYVRGAGLLGIELWGGGGFMANSTISNNIVLGSTAQHAFGISMNDCTYVKAEGNIVILQEGDFGIEAANLCVHCSIVDNLVNVHLANGNQHTTASAIALTFNSGAAGPSNTVVNNNNVAGGKYGVFVQGSTNTTVTGNNIRDCESLVFTQKSSQINIYSNRLIAPCASFLFIDGTSANISDIDFSYNHLSGLASSYAFFGYNNSTSYTITNLRVAYNNVLGATATTGSYNWAWDSNEIIGLRQYDNVYSRAGGTAVALIDYDMPAGSNPNGWRTYTATPTNVTLGTGHVLNGKFAQVGKTVFFHIDLKLGTSGAVTGNVIFPLPVTSVSYTGTAGLHVLGSGRGYDASGASADLQVDWATTTTVSVQVAVTSGTYASQTQCSATVPWTWAVDDEIVIQGCYEAA